MDSKPSTYMRIHDVITGALIMGTWATYNLSTQVDSRETKALIHKVLLPVLGISIISYSGILQTPYKIASFFIRKIRNKADNSKPHISSDKKIPSPSTTSPESINKANSNLIKPQMSIETNTLKNNEFVVTAPKGLPKLSRRNSSTTTIANDDKDTEILVHNVSHSDVILALSNENINSKNEKEEEEEEEEPILARPHFFSFNPVISNVLNWMSNRQYASACARTLERNSQDPKHSFVGGGDIVHVGLKLNPPCPLTRLSKRSHIQTKLSFRKSDYEKLKNKVLLYNLQSHGISGGDSSDSDNGYSEKNNNVIVDNNNDEDDDENDENDEEEKMSKIDAYILKQCNVSDVYFPLMATMLPVWISKLKEKHPSSFSPRSSSSSAQSLQPSLTEDETPSIRKIIILVSGEGVPRSESGVSDQNSTESTSKIMEQWIKFHYPYVEVIRKHSKTNLFRYDENIAFVKKKLLPSLESLRDYKALTKGEKWVDAFRLTVSFASGSPARITAIQSSLRNYRPEFFHIWQRKTFWEKSMVCLDDIEFLSSNDLDTLSAEPVKSLEGNLELIVNQLIKLKNKYKQTLLAQNHDMDTFWHRKSKKVVLSVLLVEKEEVDENGHKIIKLYDGTNMEVSMPTGSLCAERNAIGSALSDDLSLKRTELKIIAVLGFNLKAKPVSMSTCSTPRAHVPSISEPPILELGSPNHPTPPPILQKTISLNITPRSRHSSNADEIINQDESLTTSNSLFSSQNQNSGSGIPPGFDDDDDDDKIKNVEPVLNDLSPPSMPSPSRTHIVRDFIHPDDDDDDDLNQSRHNNNIEILHESNWTSTNKDVHGLIKKNFGMNSPKSSSSSNVTTPAQTAFHVKVCENDMNPLKPCGSCSEWLKKIAEVNPSFKVLSFTDENCSGGVYVESIFDS